MFTETVLYKRGASVLLGAVGMILFFVSAPAAAESIHPETDVHAEEDGHEHIAAVEDANREDDHAGEEEEAEALVHVTAEQRNLIAVQVSRATAGELESALQLSGEIQLNRDETANIMPRMPGFVNRIEVKEGDTIASGQLLAMLTSHKLGEYYSNYNSALEMENLTRSEFAMAEKLRDRDATSLKEFLRYKREYADAEIARRRAEELLNSLLLDPDHSAHPHDKKLKLEFPICTEYEIRSPLAGTLIMKNITLGENFPEDNATVVFTVSNLKHLWLELRAPAADLGSVKLGDGVTIRTADSPGEYTGRVIYISPLIDEQTRTGVIRVLVDNESGALRPGQFATGVIAVEQRGDMVIIPRESVQLIDGKTVVFVPRNDGFTPKNVVVGGSAKGLVQIVSGLLPGEEFVSGGAFELKSILLTSGMDAHAGHGH